MAKFISENRLYFVKALNEAISIKMRDEIDGCTENSHTSLRHKIIMKQIAKGKCVEVGDKIHAIRRAIAVAIIAAILACTSCTVAIINRKKIAGFIEQSYDKFFSVSADEENIENIETYPTEIETVYEFTYMPEGYELKSKTVQTLVVMYVYEDSSGERITLKQKVIDKSEFKMDNESGYSKIMVIDEIDIYTREDRINTYIFKFNGYILQIQFKNKIDNEELDKMIKGIK